MTASLVFWGNILGKTLLASLWQSLLVFCALRLLLWIMRDAAARLRYNLSVGALSVLGVWFAATFYAQWALQQQAAAFVIQVTAAGYPLAGAVDQGGGLVVSSFAIASLIPWLGLVYAAGLVLFSCRVFGDVVLLRKIRHSRHLPFDPAWEHYLDRLSRVWKITRKVRLFLSEKIDIPIVVGYLKPVIYLPLSMASNLPATQIEAILLHELAHVKRMDFFVNILQTVVETVLFFNPLVWWISKTIRRERENSCDDLVVSRTQPRTYAQALLALEENRMRTGRFVLAAADEKNQLFHRIKRMMEMKTKKLNVLQKLMVVAILAVSLLSVAWLAPAPIPRSSHHKGVIRDTVRPAPPPPPVPVPAPVPPVPPVPATPAVSAPLPPLPPHRRPPVPDSLPRPDDTATMAAFPFHMPDRAMNDSAVSRLQRQISTMVQSRQWQEYQKALQHYASSLQAYFTSKDWQDQQRKLQQSAKAFRDQFNQEDWKAYGEAAKAAAEKTKAYFQSDAWRNRMDSMKTLMEQYRPRIDSMAARMSHDRMLWAKGPNGMVFTDAHTTDPTRLASMLQSDGLLKKESQYQIRINEDGLFIDGKKQAATYGEKYRKIVGDHTSVLIKKNGDKLKSEIKTTH